MPLTPLTPEQRTEALQKAAAVRKERAGIKDRLKAGGLTVAEILRSAESSDVIGKMKVSEMLGAVPGVGKVRAKQIMGRHGIADGRRLRGLGANQRKAIEEEFSAA